MVTLLSVCSVIFILINISSAQSPCTTPDNFNGNCVVLQQCRPLYKLLRPDLPTEQRDLLRNSQCGRQGNSILVCCPNTFTLNDLPQTCGEQVEDKIVGGEETNLLEFPWMALIHYRKPNRQGFFCGGTLIHENYVVTAAHCIKSPKLVQERYVIDSVRFGEHDLRTDPDCQQGFCSNLVVNIPVGKITVHENYVPTSITQEHDIALIRLQNPAPYTDFIRPICLPLGRLQNKNLDGLPLTVAGFGRTENASRSEYKQKLQVFGFNLNECKSIYRINGIALTNGQQLCAGGEEDKDSCNGDSGGPLVAQEENEDPTKLQSPYHYLVGVVSFGPKHCGTAGFPGVYTRIDQYINWILDHMQK